MSGADEPQVFAIIDYTWDGDSLATTGETQAVQGEAQILRWTAPRGVATRRAARAAYLNAEGDTDLMDYAVLPPCPPSTWEIDGEDVPTLVIR